MAKTKGTRPTGPNAKLQGKPIPHAATPANAGPEDTPHSNGDWYGGMKECVAPVKHTAPQRGSRKSF